MLLAFSGGGQGANCPTAYGVVLNTSRNNTPQNADNPDEKCCRDSENLDALTWLKRSLRCARPILRAKQRFCSLKSRKWPASSSAPMIKGSKVKHVDHSSA